MKKNGFTIIELLAVLIILGIVVGITIVSVNGSGENAKKKTERIFIKNLEEAIGVYLETDALKDNSVPYYFTCDIKKKNSYIPAYIRDEKISFSDIFNSDYAPMNESNFVNPVNKDTNCNLNEKIITIYRDDDYVYYYGFNANDLSCITYNNEIFSSFPETTCYSRVS